MSLKFFQKVLPPAKQISVFDKKADGYLSGIKEYLDTLHEIVDEPTTSQSSVRRHIAKGSPNDTIPIQGKPICTICSITFEHFEAQREHFKLDWHRYNVKQNALGRQVSSEDFFEEQISGEVSSISASDSESESEDDDMEPFFNKYNREISEEEKQIAQKSLFSQHPTKTFYVAKDGTLISFYKNVLPQTFNAGGNKDDNLMPQLKKSSIWVYLMLSAGHFAAAVFEEAKVMEHKTFHRYTVRAKRGTIQSVQDKKQGNAKSAGASIRRYNEAALAQDIQNLIESWSSHIKNADKIFFKCSTYHMNIIFGEKSILSKNDPRISKISIMTKRPTFKEVQRIHQLFSNLSVYDLVSSIEETIRNELPSRVVEKNEKIIRPGGKDEEELCRGDDEKNVAGKSGEEENAADEENAGDEENEGDEEQETPMGKGTKTTKKKIKKGKIKTNEKLDQEIQERVLDENEQLWNELYLFLKNKNHDEIKSFLSLPCAIADAHKTTQEIVEPNSACANNKSSELSKNASNEMNKDTYSELDKQQEGVACEAIPTACTADSKRKRLHFLENNYLNFCSPQYNETLLHRAVVLNDREMVWCLLELGADPSMINSQGKVPYDVATEKETRNEFRRFMAKYPEKYDFKKAKVPAPLTEEQEAEQRRKSSEKKKQQQKARKERLKVKKAVENQEKAAEQEKKKFDSLSDREKRAVMAERRFAAQLTDSLRCSHCRNAIEAKSMFERFEFKYCSTKCVHEHKVVIGK